MIGHSGIEKWYLARFIPLKCRFDSDFRHMKKIIIPSTGAIQSPPDERNWTLASAGAPTTLPKECFIAQEDMRVSYQKKIGCCVGCTFEEIVRLVDLRNNGVQEELSYRFVYALAKCLDGFAGEGTYPALVAKIVNDYGVPLAKYCPNDTDLSHETFVYGRDMSKIPAEAFKNALERKKKLPYFFGTISEEGVKQALVFAKENNGAVAILRKIGDTYWTDKNGAVTWDKARILPLRPTSNIVSGHEEMLYGYDTEPKTGRTRIYWLNHWSEGWADNGRGWEYLDEWLPYIKEIIVMTGGVKLNKKFTYRFTKTLEKGAKGPDVVALQHVLQLEGVYPKDVGFTGNYGDITFNAVMKLQKKYAKEILAPVGLKIGTGRVGPSTLAWLNKYYA
jgi:hypothetical protein